MSDEYERWCRYYRATEARLADLEHSPVRRWIESWPEWERRVARALLREARR